MSSIKKFNGEIFKIVIQFSKINQLLDDYVVYTKNKNGRVAKEVDFNFNDGIRSINPLGAIASSTVSISIQDANDTLNPLNTNSDYADYLINGIPVKLFISVLDENDEPTWQPYYFGFINTWNTSFARGANQVVEINCEDILNRLGGVEVETLGKLENIPNSYDLLTLILAKSLINYDPDLGSGETKYIITAAAQAKMEANIPNLTYQNKTKIRSVINKILESGLCYLTVNQKGQLYIDVLVLSSYTANYQINGKMLGAINFRRSESTNYTRIEVSYIDENAILYEKLIEQSDWTVNTTNTAADNTLKLTLPDTTYSIEDIIITQPSPELVDHIDWDYALGILNVSPVFVSEASGSATLNLSVYGLSEGGKARMKAYYDIPAVPDQQATKTLTYSTDKMMTSEAAEDLAEDIGEFINSLQRQVIIDTSPITPLLSIGEIVEIEDVNDTYDGSYRVSAIGVNYGETYNLEMTLLKLL